ncbi:L,D-transpeptidase family protein [Rhizorhapis suberifaciens]|uniref:Lipoprotein-anchoring transpeptidase ErfK/SrfK n=1 Tax=Rhizorhapis suberifaciens TaxID=13656 RepID=A0A840HY57_9SPHN|nr:L,D-transpeptidase family protein [Rhizorhapis suberifaciens]MBB4642499.1 lipoprotein-anchoring transpeptidase ErfK/SrfK [Rhizorhapis suberifaciens]
MTRLILASLALLTACDIKVDGKDSTGATNGGAAATGEKLSAPSPSLQFPDAGKADSYVAPLPQLAAQVALDRAGFSSGAIDGKDGRFFELAVRGFQEANGLQVSGKLDPDTSQALQLGQVPATRLVKIPASFAQGPFVPDLPDDATKQAKFPALGYRDLMEALAERFHTTPQTLVALNSPQTKVGAGRVIRVPNIADIDPSSLLQDQRGWNRTLQTLAITPDQPAASKIVVDKSDKLLKVLDAQEKLIAQFPATMGSSHDPLPIGTWKIQGVSRNPDFHYNPDLFWDVSDNKKAQLLKPGPNNPVGVVWIDLSKPHYGIHGTGEPSTIGRSQSHGCVRLTNWDAARLAQMVKPGLPAIFQE